MTMMNTVLDQVRKMDNAELNTVIAAIKAQRTYISKQATRKLRIGDIVSFDSSTGTVTGAVTKVNPKTVLVRDSSSRTQWKVTASLLTHLNVGG